MTENPQDKIPDMSRRDVLRVAGTALAGCLLVHASPAAAQAVRGGKASAAAATAGLLGARLQGVQHFGLTVQNVNRAYEFTRRCSVAPK